MNEIIKKLFVDNGFTKKEVEGISKSQLYFDPMNTSYWIICNIDIKRINDVQAELISVINKKLNEKEFEKNVYILILWELDEDEELDNNQVIQVEEQEYFAKKYVLYYWKKELEDLTNKFKSFEGNNYKSISEKLLLDKKTFMKIKESESNWARLLYRIAIKTPLINIATNLKEAVLEDVEAVIEKKIQEDTLIKLKDKEDIIDVIELSKDFNIDKAREIYRLKNNNDS